MAIQIDSGYVSLYFLSGFSASRKNLRRLYSLMKKFEILNTLHISNICKCLRGTEHDYDSPYEFSEHVKTCVGDILKRSLGNSTESRRASVDTGIHSLSTLECAARYGTGFKRLWCEMPKASDTLSHVVYTCFLLLFVMLALMFSFCLCCWPFAGIHSRCGIVDCWRWCRWNRDVYKK